MDLLHILFTLYVLSVASIDAIRFHLGQNQRKCLREEIHKDVLVTGDYEVQENGQRADLSVSAFSDIALWTTHMLWSLEDIAPFFFKFRVSRDSQYTESKPVSSRRQDEERDASKLLYFRLD